MRNFKKIVFLMILLSCSSAFAKKKKKVVETQRADAFLDALDTIQVDQALEELSMLEDELSDEVIYHEGERYISVDELEAVFRKILREEGN